MLSGNALKWIGIITMFIDHVGAVFIGTGILHIDCHGLWPRSMDLTGSMGVSWEEGWLLTGGIFRIVGRVAFPLFAFLLVEGFFHTRNLKNYMKNLLLFAFISEIPFDLAASNSLMDFRYQNVFFTLFIGLAVMAAMERFSNTEYRMGAFLAGCGAAWLLRSDYDVTGILIITAFYLFHEDKVLRTFAAGALTAWETLYYYGGAALALVPIWFYNGTRGKSRLKYFFYWFYPVHLLFLYILREVYWRLI